MTKFQLAFWKRSSNSKTSKHERTGDNRQIGFDFTAKKPTAVSTNEAAISPIIKKTKSRVPIQVGLDFGTSATKVAYSVYGAKGTRLIDFEHGLSHFPGYCLPSVAAVDRRGKLLLGIKAAQYLRAEEWDTGFHRFKVLVAGRCDDKFRDSATEEKFESYRKASGYAESFNPSHLSALFLADTMMNVRDILAARPEFQEAELDLSFNICMPIDYLENNNTKREFESIFRWAESIYRARQGAGIDQDLLELSLKCQAIEIPKEEVRVFGIPESIAQVASYLVSLRRREGLHAVVDIGAGTTDISLFNLSSHNVGGGNISYWYAARNLSLGTVNIERQLAKYLKRKGLQHVCSHSRMSEVLSRLPALIAKPEYAEFRPIYTDELRKVIASEDYRHTWFNAYEHNKSPEDWSKVEVFKSGGGAGLPNVDAILSKPFFEGSFLDYQYPVHNIPSTDDYQQNGDGIPFGRTAVAYGLAIPKPRLEQYILPQDCPNQTKAPLPVWDYDRDIIYSK